MTVFAMNDGKKMVKCNDGYKISMLSGTASRKVDARVTLTDAPLR